MIPYILIAQRSESDSLFVRHTLQKISPESDFKKSLPTSVAGVPISRDILRKRKMVFHGSVMVQSQYLYNQGTPLSSGGFFNTIGFTGKTEIFKLPVSIGLQLTMHDKQFRADYTAFNVSFDANAYKEKLKADYLSRISSLPAYFGNELGAQLVHFEDSLRDYEKYKNILSKPDYYNQLNAYTARLKALQDSIARDSSFAAVRDGYNKAHDTIQNRVQRAEDSLSQNPKVAKAMAEYHYLSDTLTKLKAIAQKYTNMESYRRQNLDYLKQLDQYHKYLDKIKATADITRIPGIEDKLRQTGLMNKTTKFISGIQSFGFGRVSLSLSRYTVQSQSIYGFNVDYLWKKSLYTGIGAGFAAPYSFQFTPNALLNDNPLAKFDFHRILMYARIGYGGLKDNHIHLIWMSYMDRFAPTPAGIVSPLTPPANSVLALECLQKINAVLKFNCEVALSNSSFLHRSASFVPFSIIAFNFAAQMGIKGEITKSHTTFGIKGEVVSNDFNTVGNLFLRRDFAAYTAEARQSFLSSRFTLSTMLTHSFQGFDHQSPQMQYISLNNSLAARLAFGTYTLSYLLTRQLPYGHSDLTSAMSGHSISLLQQYTYSAGKVNFLTSLTSTYSENKFIGPEIGSYTLSLQNGAQQDITFSPIVTWRIGAGSTYMRSPLSAIPSLGYWTETGNTFTVNKILNITYVARFTHDGLYADNVRGTASFSIAIYKGLKLSAKASVTNSIGNSQFPAYNYINATAGINYAW